MRVLRTALPPLICLMILGVSEPAGANYRTDLASAFDDDDPYDFNVKVGYTRTLRRGAIRRELNTQFGVDYAKELRYSQIRQVLNVRAEAAIYKDLQLHVEIPIVLYDKRKLNFAQNGGDSCGSPAYTNCVTKENSTLVDDGFIQNPTAMPGNTPGLQVAGPDPAPGSLQTPNRTGLDQLHLGLSWAPINQARDYTKPTWVLGFEARIAVGQPMEYNPYFNPSQPESDLNPEGNSSVGRGLHELRFFMTLSKRFKYIDPYIGFFYMLPIATSDSLYEKTSFDLSGQERHQPQQKGGAEAGLEIIAWENPDKQQKVSIELGAMVQGVFEGRGYSDMWELLANNPRMQGPCSPLWRADLKQWETRKVENWNNGSYCGASAADVASGKAYIPYPGISSIENHAEFKASLAINVEMTKWFWGQIGVGFGHEQQHYITFADAGRSGDNGQIDRVVEEVNPMFRPVVDYVGQRFRVGEATVFDFNVALMGRF